MIYNCFTAIGALILISPFISVWQSTINPQITANAEIALVAFHTSFNLIGAALVLPFTRQFAALMEKLVPETRSRFARGLDRAMLKEPGVALMAAQKIIASEFLTLMVNINLILEQQTQELRADMPELQQVLDETHDFLDQIHMPDHESREARQLIALIHAINHMQRLHERCDEDLERAIVASMRSELTEAEVVLDEKIDEIIEAVNAQQLQRAAKLSAQTYQHTLEMEDPQREKIYRAVARGDIDVRYATENAEALRWLTRVSRHINRICYYLQIAQEARSGKKETLPQQG